jgi:23S rRNA pseudouridine1911/1915/1917 synthase
MTYTVLYTDREIAVCVKPSGMLSQADEKGEKGLKELLEEELSRPVYLIHRLDRPVSGLMVFALDGKAAGKLSAEVADHTRFVKEYMTVVSGRPADDTGVLRDYLFRDRFSGKTFAVSTPRKGAKDAELEYTRLDTVNHGENGEISLIKVRLHTGRTHQIRVQFASRGYPVVGDGKYGSRIKAEGIALHSYKLGFHHPKTDKFVEFTASPKEQPMFNLFNNELFEEN